LQEKFSPDAFGEFLAPLRVAASTRGDLLAILKAMYRNDALHVTCWRDLARLLDSVRASAEMLREARILWAQFKQQNTEARR
jgi:hypothetical protein